MIERSSPGWNFSWHKADLKVLWNSYCTCTAIFYKNHMYGNMSKRYFSGVLSHRIMFYLSLREEQEVSRDGWFERSRQGWSRIETDVEPVFLWKRTVSHTSASQLSI